MVSFSIAVVVAALNLLAVAAFRTLQHEKYLCKTRSCSSFLAGIREDLPQSTSQQFRNKFLQAVPVTSKVATILFPAFFIPGIVRDSRADDSSPAPAVDSTEVAQPPPTNFGLKYDYYSDCQQLVDHMRYAVQLKKGDPIISEFAQKTKDEMIDFVSYYRLFNGVSGKQTFSLLYTTINVLAGHYTSYGTKVPVPEKRRKRILQELKDVEKNIRKKR